MRKVRRKPADKDDSDNELLAQRVRISPPILPEGVLEGVTKQLYTYAEKTLVEFF